MQFAFDLISDLHLETWPDEFDWQGQSTAPFCVVAGDIAKNQNQVIQVLENLSRCYQAVFYIDGNDEHKFNMRNLGQSYKDLSRRLAKIKNCIYLQDNVVVINGVAFLAANGWWSFDLDRKISVTQSKLWWEDDMTRAKYEVDSAAVEHLAHTDAEYLIKSVHRLQRHNDVKKIVCITHTVPRADLINHDIAINGHPRFNVMGNSLMQRAQEVDTEKKIHTWCFGHYHGAIDQLRDGVRYVNNCRGRGDTAYRQLAYFPRRIELD